MLITCSARLHRSLESSGAQGVPLVVLIQKRYMERGGKRYVPELWVGKGGHLAWSECVRLAYRFRRDRARFSRCMNRSGCKRFAFVRRKMTFVPPRIIAQDSFDYVGLQLFGTTGVPSDFVWRWDQGLGLLLRQLPFAGVIERFVTGFGRLGDGMCFFCGVHSSSYGACPGYLATIRDNSDRWVEGILQMADFPLDLEARIWMVAALEKGYEFRTRCNELIGEFWVSVVLPTFFTLVGLPTSRYSRWVNVFRALTHVDTSVYVPSRRDVIRTVSVVVLERIWKTSFFRWFMDRCGLHGDFPSLSGYDVFLATIRRGSRIWDSTPSNMLLRVLDHLPKVSPVLVTRPMRNYKQDVNRMFKGTAEYERSRAHGGDFQMVIDLRETRAGPDRLSVAWANLLDWDPQRSRAREEAMGVAVSGRSTIRDPLLILCRLADNLDLTVEERLSIAIKMGWDQIWAETYSQTPPGYLTAQIERDTKIEVRWLMSDDRDSWELDYDGLRKRSRGLSNRARY